MRSHDFPEHADENRRIWNTNARWWDDRIGEGNDFQTLLIEPATERLLNVTTGDTILDVACGAGRFTRRMASLGATVVAIDTSSEFIARARERTPSVTHPCFHSATMQRFAEMYEEGPGRHVIRTGVKVSSPHFFFHRPLSRLLQQGFDAGFVVDGFEEPGFTPAETPKAGVKWNDMPDIPPILVVRMRRG